MQKICALILLTALVSNYEALPQTKWSRQLRNPQGQLIRERRQFPFGEWIPLSQPCPTCRPFADPLDAGLKLDSIGLTPPRPPTVTRQIHGEGNFFPRDESSILSVPPPPPSAIPRHPIGTSNGNFQNLQFNNFAQQFNNPLTVPTQRIFPQTQQIQFLPQTFLPNQQLLVNNNQQILPVLSTPNTLFGQENQGKQQQINSGKVPKFNSEFKQQKPAENVLLEQNKRPAQATPRPFTESPFRNKPSPFTAPPQQQQQNQQQVFKQQNQQQQGFVQQQQQQGFAQQHQQQGLFQQQQQQQRFIQQQPLIQHQQQQQQHSVNFGDSILTPPPAPNATAQNIVIPGLDKEEIQLLYVPVETLRQRGNFQEQLLAQQPQNIQFHNRPSASPSPVSPQLNQQTTTKQQAKGHFVTQEGNNNGEQSVSTLKVTPAQPFPTTVTPSSLLLQNIPFQQTPQPFVSATPITPATPTIQPFVTSSPTKFSPFTPETTLSHLSTIPNAIQFSQPGLEFGTTAKSIFQEEIINGKSQFSNFKEPAFQGVQFQQPQVTLQQQQQQPFVNQQQSERPPQQSTVFLQQGQQQKDIQLQNALSKQQLQEQQQALVQKQQLLQQQKEKELQQKYLLERQQKEAEAQRLLAQQRQKELEEQRILQQQQQQRQKELEEQRLLQQQRQKELEEQRLLQQQRQKELEQQRYLQEQKQKELEQQRFLQQQRQRELETQRQLQLQRQRELEEKRRLQLQKQREQEEQQRLLRLQQQQKELEEQRLLQQQQEQQRLLQQQKLEQQNQENLKKQQQYQFIQQQQQKQQPQQEALQQPNRHTLPVNDKLNSIAQLAKESEPDDSQLVPHQPPLSVFFRGYEGAQPRILDVLRELRTSKTITVLDQYFEKMPKVFVGPAGLIPPAGYGKFELPYLSNLETNRIERKIDRLPFFVAPLNFIPPPGYSKIPFPAPHVGSVVISSENNPAMKQLLPNEKENNVALSEENSDSGSYPVVGPEVPGLVNSLETETTTFKPAVFSSTPSLPQTTAQLRNRRPNTSLYRTQNRKPISKTRLQTTTSKPEEEVTQPAQKSDSESGVRKPFNRFLKRRRPQAKTTTESSVTNDQEGKNLENRFYSVEVYHKQKNANSPRHDQFQEKQSAEPNQFEQQAGNIDRTTPQGQNVYDIQPTPGFYKTDPTGSATESNERRPPILDYPGVNNLQTYEDGPFPTGSAKTITHELYRPNSIRPALPQQQQQQYEDSVSSKFQPKPDTSLGLEKPHEVPESPKLIDISEVNPTAAFVGTTGQKSTVAQDAVKIQPTAETGFERQDITLGTSDKYYGNEGAYTPGSVTAPEEQKSTSFVGSDEQYTSAFAEISKHHHIPSPADSSKRQQTQFSSEPQSSPEIAQHLQAPFSEQHFTQEQHSQEYGTIEQAFARPTPNTANVPNPQFFSVGPSNEQYPTNYAAVSNNGQTSDFASTAHGQVNPTAPGAPQQQYTTGFSVNSNSQNAQVENTEDLRRPSFINFHNVQGTPEPTEKSHAQYYPSSTQGQQQEYEAVTEAVKNYEYPKVVEQNYVPVTPETLPQVSETPSTQNYQQESVSEDLTQINDQKQTTEGQGQNYDDNLSNTHRLKIPNPSIVKVRTRVRGKSRGQLNFAASQTTTQAPYTRSRVENKNTDNSEQEYATKTNSYQPVKISKYNQYRGLKKPVRPTTEAATESEQKVNVYTIRPQRRPSNPSTVSTKRIRRPTTPVPTLESSSDGISIVTPGTQVHAEESEFSPSGVSNDVYYEHTSFSPIRNKYRKHFGTPEEKSDVVPSYTPTAYPSTIRTHLSTVQDHSNEEVNVIKDFTHTLRQENYDKYPEWNPAESGLDVSGIVLTTTGAPVTHHDDQLEVEEPKKTQDSKKAFDPDLEKKSGRRRVRVRVHKRPHENFETAESQNLRTVANVLVPPTSTYKPSDESNLHQLVKNSDYSFGGQKSYGIRSRDYFRKRLNLTQTERTEEKQETIDDAEEGNSERRQTIKTQIDSQDEVPVTTGGSPVESLPGTKVRGYVRKVQKLHKKENDSVSNQSTEDNSSGNTGNKHGRTKFRGYVRKIIKHGDGGRENGNDSNQSADSGEVEAKQDNIEHHTRQHFRGNHGVFNQTGRVNGTRHRTFVRYVKKNKVRTQETESHQEPEVQQREEQAIHQTTETLTEQPKIQPSDVSESQTEAQQLKEQEILQTQYPVYRSTEQPENNKQTEESEASQTLKPVSTSEKEVETEQTEQTEQPEQPESRQTPEVIKQTTQEPESDRTLPQESHETEESEVRQTQPTEAPRTQETVQQYTQRAKYYQTLRPISQRTQYTGFYRTTENHVSTTERTTTEFQEKRDGPIRPKYGKTSGYGSESKFEEPKKTNEHHFEQQNRNKNSHIFEIRKYLRTKNREGAFSQFSKNRYFTSEKTETVETSKEDSREDKSSEEITTPVETTPIESEPKTTNTFAPNADSVEVQGETTKNDEELETKFTTEEIETSTELARHEDDSKDITIPVQAETTTEGKTDFPTTLYQTSDRNDQITESKTEGTIPTERNEISHTEIQPDLYRFSKSSFSFDETEKFTGTKNRAHVRNITADIIENTASFSAPGIDKHTDSNLVVPTTTSNENTETITESHSDVSSHEKTEEEATELNSVGATTEYPDNTETESTAATEAVTKAKIAKLIKTSTTTKVSHETEICYKGKCIRTKSENPDEDLKLLVDSASTMKIEKPKT